MPPAQRLSHPHSTGVSDGAAQGLSAWLERWRVFASDILQHPRSRGWASEGLPSLCSGLSLCPSGAHNQVTLAFLILVPVLCMVLGTS